MPPELLEFTIGDEELTLEYQSRRNGSFIAMVDDLELVVFIKSRQGQQITLEIDGRLLSFTVTADGDRFVVVRNVLESGDRGAMVLVQNGYAQFKDQQR